MIVVADTGPVNYLILSGHIDLIPRLYGSLILPASAQRELLHPKAPASVRGWAGTLPAWAEIRVAKDSSRFADLGPGERETIALALEITASFVIIDEAQGRRVAVACGLPVKGILAVLQDAAARRLIDLRQAIEKLRATNIFLSDDVVQHVLLRHREGSAEKA